MTPDDPSLRGPGHPMDPKDTDNLTDPTDPADPGGLAGLLRPRVRRYTAWGDLGHTDPTMLAGRPRIAYLHVLALALAAGADIGAFYQVIELVMPQQNAQLVLAVVLGFTATVLYLAHICGVQLRDAKAGAKTVHRSAAYLCMTVWLLLGVIALTVRLLVTSVQTASVTPSFGAPAAPPPTQGLELRAGNGAIFFALYVATGLVAAVGGYLTHNPVRDSYAAAARGYRKAAKKAAAAAHRVAKAQAEHNMHITEIDSAATILRQSVTARRAIAENLKQTARVLIAQRAKDPAVTDAMFEADRRPYPWDDPADPLEDPDDPDDPDDPESRRR